MEGDTYSLLQLGSESTQNMLTEWLARCRPVCLLIFPLVFSRLKLICGFIDSYLGCKGRSRSFDTKKRNPGNSHPQTYVITFLLSSSQLTNPTRYSFQATTTRDSIRKGILWLPASPIYRVCYFHSLNVESQVGRSTFTLHRRTGVSSWCGEVVMGLNNTQATSVQEGLMPRS